MEGKKTIGVTRDFTNLKYQAGLGNSFETEVLEGAIPKNRNSPQKCPYGLYAEQITGTSFTAPRANSQMTFIYMIKPSCNHKPYTTIDKKVNYTKIKNNFYNDEDLQVTPTQLRWAPLSEPKDKQLNWVESLITVCGAGDPSIKNGLAIYLYGANASMHNKAFYSSDGDFLIVPQKGTLYITTELGKLVVEPTEIVVIPRGIKFSIDIEGFARGYALEVFKAHFKLPDLGPIGTTGLAVPRDFLIPTAWYEEVQEKYTIINKYAGKFFEYEQDHSPFNIVGWRGNYYPYKYNLKNFNAMGSVSYDHPDPSILTVLTVQTDEPGTAVCDFILFPPRWEVQENTFRPAWYHRNTASEYNGYIWAPGVPEKEGEFFPGTSSLHVTMAGHGPDPQGFEKNTTNELKPSKIEDSFAFMFETSYLLQTTKFAFDDIPLYKDAWQRWDNLKSYFTPDQL